MNTPSPFQLGITSPNRVIYSKHAFPQAGDQRVQGHWQQRSGRTGQSSGPSWPRPMPSASCGRTATPEPNGVGALSSELAATQHPDQEQQGNPWGHERAIELCQQQNHNGSDSSSDGVFDHCPDGLEMVWGRVLTVLDSPVIREEAKWSSTPNCRPPRAAGSRCAHCLSVVPDTPVLFRLPPPTHQTKASSHTNATSDAPAIVIGAHWSRKTRVITTKQLTQ